MTVIYNIVSQSDNSVIYIGRTIDFDSRKKAHLKDKRFKSANIDIVEIVDDCLATKKEQYWIDYFTGLGHKLFNIYKASEKILSTRKQTYPFKTMDIGATFKVTKQKYNSMLTAYRYHNNKFNKIEISAELSSPGFYEITRIS